MISAITSCTNTSNPSVMLGAGKLIEHSFFGNGVYSLYGVACQDYWPRRQLKMDYQLLHTSRPACLLGLV